jgi:DnaK suppressor protein
MRQSTIARKTVSAAELGPLLPAFRAKLHAQRQFRKEQLDHLTMDATEAIVTSDHERLQITRALESAAESALREIEDAQQRLEQGGYGMCEGCAEPISWERLEALPMSRLCTSCQRLADLASTRPLHAGFGRAA